MGKTLTREEWLEQQKAEQRSRPSELAGKLEAPPAPPQPVPLGDMKAARSWLSEELERFPRILPTALKRAVFAVGSTLPAAAREVMVGTAIRLAAYDVPRPGIRRAILLRARKKLAKRDRG